MLAAFLFDWTLHLLGGEDCPPLEVVEVNLRDIQPGDLVTAWFEPTGADVE